VSDIARLADDELAALVKETFWWGMHVCGMYEFRYAQTQLRSHPGFVGEGRMNWDRAPRSAADKSITTPNASTLYGFGFYDLSRGPVVVATPDVPERYFSIQACDQYPRWFFEVGNQFTGRGAAEFLITGPGFDGPFPTGFAGSQVFPAPSSFVMVAGRYALKSNEPDELAAVNALMDETTVAPVEQWLANDRRPLRSEDQPVVVPEHATFPRMSELVAIAEALTALDLLQLASLVLNDPTMTPRSDSAKELATLEQIAKLGVRRGVAFDPSWLTDAQIQVAEAAFAEAKKESAQHAFQSMKSVNGWLSGHEFLESLDDYVRQAFYGLTTLGAPISRRSHAGAFGNVDTEGRPFDGAASAYTLTFRMDALPPVSEFWELPIYDQNGYFVDNEIDRYSITSFMLERDDLHVDGDTLTIYIRHDRPSEPDQARNWLPAPQGPFRFAFRFYGPKDGLLDWTYPMPGVVRVD
jgi:hypothetical protein